MSGPRPPSDGPLNAFCVDLEEWFHVCGVDTEYSDPERWDGAPSHVVRDTETLMRLLDETGARATFLTVGWVAERHPDLIRSLADAGHEIGCHGYYHRLVFDLTPEELEEEIARSVALLRELSGQPVRVFRAPGFSITRESFWAYPILARHGLDVDTSIVPARRDHGGVDRFTRDPFLLRTEDGDVRCFPVSVMTVAGRTLPFSGGGYLRLFPRKLIERGYRQNHRQGRPGMCYIHPREINPDQPRLDLPRLKSFKYYVNLDKTAAKLRWCLRRFRFTTVSEVLDSVRHWPEYQLVDGEAGRDIRPA